MGWTAQLIDSWKNDGLSIAEGAAEEEISTFEREHHVKVPPAFREYLLAVNGMVSTDDTDGRLFAFWPLARMKPALEVYPAYADRARDCFMFADFMISSFEYAIDMNAESKHRGSVILVGAQNPQTISLSFPEFVGLYLRDAAELYGTK
jgi:hypothetical protein